LAQDQIAIFVLIFRKNDLTPEISVSSYQAWAYAVICLIRKAPHKRQEMRINECKRHHGNAHEPPSSSSLTELASLQSRHNSEHPVQV